MTELRCHREYRALSSALGGADPFASESAYAAITRVNRALNPVIIDAFIEHVQAFGFRGATQFFHSRDEDEIHEIYLDWLTSPLPADVRLCDGFGEAYDARTSVRYLPAWALRQSVIMTIQPAMRPLVAARTPEAKWATVLTRIHAAMAGAGVAPSGSPDAILEALYRGLEGSYRSRAALEIEGQVRAAMRDALAIAGMADTVEPGSVRLFGESYDLACLTGPMSLLGTVKSRGSIGGCHSSIYRRDVQVPIEVAREAGLRTLAVFVGRNWPQAQVEAAGADLAILVDARLSRGQSCRQLETELASALPILLDPAPGALRRLGATVRVV